MCLVQFGDYTSNTDGWMDLCNMAYKAPLVWLTAASATNSVITPGSQTQKVIFTLVLMLLVGKCTDFTVQWIQQETAVKSSELTAASVI